MDSEVLIVGGGIAGASAAYFASLAGRETILVDSGEHCASRVPTALINPVRGYQGKLMPRGLEGARFTFELIGRLIDNGYPIPHGRGLWRPAPGSTIRDLWQANLQGAVPHRWQERAPEALGLAGEWVGAMYLPDSGWVETAPLLQALTAEAGAKGRCAIVDAEVVAINSAQRGVHLADGTSLCASALLWCGGAWGASSLGYPASYRPGSVIVSGARVSSEAISYGLYAAPHGEGSAIGPTTEPISKIFDRGPSPAAWLARTHDRAAAMFAKPFDVRSIWHGVRVEEVALPPDLPRLTGFGSRGYLLAPLLASEWARDAWGSR